MYGEKGVLTKVLCLVFAGLFVVGAFAFNAEAPSLATIEVVVPGEVEFDYENETDIEIEGVVWVNGSFTEVVVTLNASSELLGDNITIPESPITFIHVAGNTVYMETFIVGADYSELEDPEGGKEDVITVYGTWEWKWTGPIGQQQESGDLDEESITVIFVIETPDNGEETPEEETEEELSRTMVYLLLGGAAVVAAVAAFFLVKKSPSESSGKKPKASNKDKKPANKDEGGVEIESGGEGKK